MTRRRAGAALEVIGPPGAGKSTLAAALAAGAMKVRVVKRFRSAGHRAVILRGGITAASIALRNPIRRSLSRQQLIWMARVESGIKMLESQPSPHATIAFDQGPIYTLARLADLAHEMRPDGPFAEWHRAKTRQLATLLDLVVAVDAPDHVLVERIAKRCKAHALEEVPVSDEMAALAAARGALDELVAELASGHGPPVLRFDSSRDPLPAMVGAVLVALRSDTGHRSDTRQG